MKGILHTILLCFLFPLLALSQGNDQCIGANVGTGSLYTKATVGCVPFTVEIEKTDENSRDNQYIYNYKGGTPVNAIPEKLFTYTKPGAYKLMQISYRKDNGQELRVCATITVLDTAKIEINPTICNNKVSLSLSDIRKNGTFPYDYCYINWGDGSSVRKVNLPANSVSHTYVNKTDKTIIVKGGYIVSDCGGSNSILLKFPVAKEPEIQELTKTGENTLMLSFNNETGSDYNIEANGDILVSQKGKLGKEQVSFNTPYSNACYSIHLLNSCESNITSKELCDIGFKLTPTINGNELSWENSTTEPIKDFILTKNNIKTLFSSNAYTDDEIACNEEYCYQIRYTSNGSTFISERLCTKNSLIPCGTAIVPIQIPTAFSPNDDLINDKLYLYGNLERFVSLKIFNRRGHIVKLINYPYEAWTGDNLLPGLYEYLLTFKSATNKESTAQGTITLIK